MKAYRAFAKKELLESFRTYKLVIMLAAFLLFGMMSPLFAKLLPEIMQNIDLGGMAITLPDPTAMDSWAQFFKNVGQMGMLVLVIVFAGIMAHELSSGTLINILTKGMKRHTVILSKLAVASMVWTVSYALCLAAAYGYTVYFWGASEMNNEFIAFFSPWLFGLMLISLLILGGILFKSFMGSLLTAGGVVAVLSMLNIIPHSQKFNPITLIGDNTALLSGGLEASDRVPTLLLCSVLIIVLTVASILLFNKKQL
jgi:ABC-2 type transport system permease protein